MDEITDKSMSYCDATGAQCSKTRHKFGKNVYRHREVSKFKLEANCKLNLVVDSKISDRSQFMGNSLNRNRSKNGRYSILLALLIYFLASNYEPEQNLDDKYLFLPAICLAEASLIIGDSAIEIQEVDPGQQQQPALSQPAQPQTVQSQSITSLEQPSVILGTTNTESVPSTTSNSNNQQQSSQNRPNDSSTNVVKPVAGPLPPIAGGKGEDVTDGDKKSRKDHDYEMKDMNSIDKVMSANDDGEDKPAITGKVVDFELTPAGGHNKAKIKKKKKKKKKKEEEMFKKWGKKKKFEKNAHEKKHKESMKKKKEEGLYL